MKEKRKELKFRKIRSISQLKNIAGTPVKCRRGSEKLL